MADLNADGKLDFIVGGASTVMVYLGNGDGTFSLKAQYSSSDGSYPSYPHMGDLNGDGIPDFIISLATGIQAFLGNGDGTFRMGGFVSFPNIAIGNPTLGDFNHDGKLDLAAPSFQTNQVQVLLGNGDGTFGSPILYATAPDPQSAFAVDLNHDGNLDLVVACQGDAPFAAAGIDVMLGNPDGTFKSPSFVQQPDWTIGGSYLPDFITASDFDGDGNVDLLVQAIGDPRTYVLYGSGTGTFQVTAVPTNALGNTCVVADFDGDGKPDIVCAGSGFTIVTNMGNRTFSANTYFPGAFSSVAAGDFNQDGKQDLIVTGGQPGGTGGAYIYLNSRAITTALVGVDQLAPQYGHPSQLSVQVNTDVDGFNTGCFSACPLGTITWFDGKVALGTSPVTPASNHSGTATFNTYFSGGLHSVSASYVGEELPSTSNTVISKPCRLPRH